jgi:hypothetical protein
LLYHGSRENRIGTPFFANLAQQGRLDYPLFGVSLQRNASPGSLSLGEVCYSPDGQPSDLVDVGAVDSTIVKNVSLIEWIEVVPFEPIGTGDNVTSYLEWAIPISTITVSTMANSSSTCVHGSVHRLGVRPLRYDPHILRQIPTSP